MEKSKGPSPFYTSCPFIFKSTGTVRRCAQAPRFSRKLGMSALRMQETLKSEQFLTVTDSETVYVLSRNQTKTVQTDSHIEDMILNGWQVYPTTDANVAMLPQLYQQELL
jgi:hypothetical protein